LDSNTIDSAFRKIAKHFSHKTALIYKDKKITYAELDRLVDNLARALLFKGVKKQDKIIIYLPHMPEWIAAWLAVQRAGAVPVPVAHHSIIGDLCYIANDCNAETVFCSINNVGQLINMLKDSIFKRIIICDMESTDGCGLCSEKEDTEIVSVYELAGMDGLPVISHIDIDDKETAGILYTSGTTGFPKGVPISHALFLELFDQSKKQSDMIVPRGDGIVLQGSPLNHILGQDKGLSALFSGETLILLAHCNLHDMLQHIEKYKVNILFGTPNLCRMILQYDKLEDFDLKSLVYVFAGGDAVTPDLSSKWRTRFGNPLYTGYGCTEACGSISAVISGVPFPEGTVGKVLPTKKTMLVNPDTMEPEKNGMVGELLVSSDNMVKEYYNNPEETAKCFVYLEGRLWFKTGDVIEIDKDGWVFFKERTVNIIKHKGYRIGPNKIEGVLLSHDAVGSCCVVGVPDEKYGEKIVACVVLKPDAGNVTSDEIIEWCKDRLVSYEVPGSVEFCNELPLNPTGKILRRKLREQISDRFRTESRG